MSTSYSSTLDASTGALSGAFLLPMHRQLCPIVAQNRSSFPAGPHASFMLHLCLHHRAGMTEASGWLQHCLLSQYCVNVKLSYSM